MSWAACYCHWAPQTSCTVVQCSRNLHSVYMHGSPKYLGNALDVCPDIMQKSPIHHLCKGRLREQGFTTWTINYGTTKSEKTVEFRMSGYMYPFATRSILPTIQSTGSTFQSNKQAPSCPHLKQIGSDNEGRQDLKAHRVDLAVTGRAARRVRGRWRPVVRSCIGGLWLRKRIHGRRGFGRRQVGAWDWFWSAHWRCHNRVDSGH